MPTYKTIYTTQGLAALAAAQASGTPVAITHMAVGDGNGNPYTPTEGQTALVREVYRAPVNRVWNEDPGITTQFTAELLVPASEGGFVMREVGVFLDNGTMLAVANLPDTYKPEDTEGAFADTAVRLQFVVANATVITPIIDPNVVIATQMWVLNTVNLALLLPGGTTGQFLAKQSNADGDVIWVNPTDVNITVDLIEEYQTLAAAQTVVTMATTTTQGLAVYIEGVRLRRGTGVDHWEPDPSAPITKVKLGRSYPAGSIIYLCQNEPNGDIGMYGVEWWLVKTTGATVAAGDHVIPDNVSAACEYFLPPDPQDGDSVDFGTSSVGFATNKMTIRRNGKTIMGFADDIEVVEDGLCVRFIWRQALNTWRIFRSAEGGINY